MVDTTAVWRKDASAVEHGATPVRDEGKRCGGGEILHCTADWELRAVRSRRCRAADHRMQEEKLQRGVSCHSPLSQGQAAWEGKALKSAAAAAAFAAGSEEINIIAKTVLV